MSVSVIIVAYESGAWLPRCLDTLRAQTVPHEVVLVDNASSDGAPQTAAMADTAIRLVEAGENLGFAGGNNLGAERAKGEWLALLNPDAFPEPDWLERLLQAAEAHPDVDCFTSLQIAEDDGRLLDGAGDALTLFGFPYRMGFRRTRPDRIAAGEVFAPCGAAMMIRTRTFRALGGFDARFFCYCEDMDLGWRLRLAGGRTRLVPNAVVHHVGSAMTGRGSAFSRRLGYRNRLWTFWKNASPGLFRLMAAPHLIATLLMLTADVARGRGGPAWQGLREGWRRRREFRAEAPRADSAPILRAMTWSPLKAIRRGLDVRV
ncbi:glycosyltransferase family 2 protein [Brevundimonas sp. 2R-24]|uniref:Glycosyltransferase family 2 protein n=1 Tax=Peiella sedimenti TaxID=3061083 RepID=A0ABT8SIS4_9CAUL|nr:glycosyltransferase family 2 protein [Caulobacteraceae bacterium XZ-24]